MPLCLTFPIYALHIATYVHVVMKTEIVMLKLIHMVATYVSEGVQLEENLKLKIVIYT